MATKIRGLQIVDSIAGAAIDLTSSGILNVLVDDSSIEVSGGNALQVKSGGVTNTMLVNDSVTVTAGAGLTGGGEVDLGGTAITLDIGGSSTISVDTDSISVIASGIDHGSLADLGADDHTQYILVDGTRDFTGIFGAVGMELTEGDVKLYSAPAAGDVSGITASGTTAATFGQVVYVDGSGNYVAAKADASATMPAAALVTAVSNEVMTAGYVTVSGWGWTPGGLLYVSDATAGDMTQTAPTASGSQVQIVGVAISATTIYFNPDATTVELGDSPFYTKEEVDALITTSSGDILSYISANYIDNSEMTTISGDILSYVSSNYIDNSEMTTISGDILTYVSNNYIDNTEMTTISGDIISYLTSTSGVIDHGNLAGLADDDHTQYLLADGSRALSGDLLPNASGTVDLGSAALPYAEIYVDDIYVKGASIHLGGYEISEFSNDDTLADASTTALPTEYAVKNYVATVSGGLENNIVWEVVDTPTNRIQPKAAHMGLPIYTSGAVTIGGDLTVTGTTFYTQTEEVLVSDNFLYINYGEPGSGVTSVTAGIDVDRGGFPSYVFAFDERNDTFRIGVSGSQDAFNDYPLQPVATREDTPTDTRVAWWDAASYTFRTHGDTYITINSGTDTISVVAPALFDVGFGSLADENYVTVATEAGDDWVGMGLAGDETYVYLDGSGNRITIQAGDDVEIQSVSGSVYLTGDGSIRLNGGTTSIYVDDDGFWFSGTSSAKVDEILNTIDADSISASSTDKQLATAKLLYNTLSGTVLDGSLTGGTPTYMYYVGADGMPATTDLMLFNGGTEVIHLGEVDSKSLETYLDIDMANGVVSLEATNNFDVHTTSGVLVQVIGTPVMQLLQMSQTLGVSDNANMVLDSNADTITFEAAGTTEVIIGTGGLALKTGGDVNEILDSGDSISPASTDDQLATAKLIYDYVNTISGAMVHNELEGLQGGNGSDEYYHLDLTAFTALSGVDGTQVGQWDTAYSHTLSTSNPHSVTYSQVGAIQDSTDTVKDTHIDWGSGANQVDLDDVPDGSSYERVAASQLNSGIYIDATTSVKGIASFSSDNFSVTSGVVTVKDEGINEAELLIANAPIDGRYLQYTTASGMQWTDVSTEGVLESDFQLDNMSASCNGVTTQFYLSYIPVANSLQVYLNGLLQEKGGGLDYTNTTSGVLFTTAPLTGDILIAHYVRTSA